MFVKFLCLQQTDIRVQFRNIGNYKLKCWSCSF